MGCLCSQAREFVRNAPRPMGKMVDAMPIDFEDTHITDRYPKSQFQREDEMKAQIRSFEASRIINELAQEESERQEQALFNKRMSAFIASQQGGTS